MGLKLDGISTNQQLDSSGEILNIAGHDISDLTEGRGVLNYEHEKGSEDIIGAIIYAKKILSLDDCENERQKLYFALSGGPYVYIIAELYEDEDHAGAVACAAMVRYYVKRNEKMFIGFSVEGQTLERDGNKLERSVGRRVAFTLRPCNKSAMMGVFEDPKLQATVTKYESYVPSHKEYEIESPIFEDNFTADPVDELKKSIVALNKTLEAGNYNVAPNQLTQGAALQVEDHGLYSRSVKNRLKAALRDWNRTRPLKEVIKAALPEISDEYVDHFVHVAEDLSLRKNMKPLVRISAANSPNMNQDEDQRRLLEGMYWDHNKEYAPGHGQYTNRLVKLLNDASEGVIVKYPSLSSTEESQPTEGARNATAYYDLAKNFFGMGDNVPVTNYFIHPQMEHEPNLQKRPFQAIKEIDGQTAFESSFEPIANKAQNEDGTIHKLALMDLISGFADRHFGNIMFNSDSGKIYHVDNDDSFNYDTSAGSPPRWLHGSPRSLITGKVDKGIANDTLHVKAKQWLDKLDPRRMASIMMRHGFDRPTIEKGVRALKVTKELSDQGSTIGNIFSTIHSQPQEQPGVQL